MMTTKKLAAIAGAGVALLLSACTMPSGYMYNGTNVNPSTWVTAKHDKDGVPIFGYAAGRAVYGYDSTKMAIFSIRALYPGCYRPKWGKAPWCEEEVTYPGGLRLSSRYPLSYPKTRSRRTSYVKTKSGGATLPSAPSSSFGGGIRLND